MTNKKEIWEKTCTICGEAVTNPICKDCVSEHLIEWFREVDPCFLDKIYDSSVIFEDLSSISKCIKCGKEMTVCKHCFTKEVHEELMNHYPKMEEDFMRMFNYEIYSW
ncbi:hypothetical protein KY334_02770 [Candidatus Woesearchaeota archaeon]|nr:hypothetical protein [Candidatus Woesearchaeota archaeon]